MSSPSVRCIVCYLVLQDDLLLASDETQQPCEPPPARLLTSKILFLLRILYLHPTFPLLLLTSSFRSSITGNRGLQPFFGLKEHHLLVQEENLTLGRWVLLLLSIALCFYAPLLK